MNSLIVDALAAARLTRLVTTDTFPPIRRAREAALELADPEGIREQPGGEPPSLAELIECNWCAGFWVSAGVLAARRFFPGVWDPIARLFATSMVVGFVATRSEHVHGDQQAIADAVRNAGTVVGQNIGAGLRGPIAGIPGAIRDAGAAVAEAVRVETVELTAVDSTWSPPETGPFGPANEEGN